jgi:hypothetical protein
LTEEEDDERNDRFNAFACVEYFSICRDGKPSRRRHDEWRLVVGNELGVLFRYHYRWSDCFGGLFDNETKVIIGGRAMSDHLTKIVNAPARKRVDSEISAKRKPVIDKA